MLKLRIEEKRGLILEKQGVVRDYQNNLKKIDRFSSDKHNEGKYYQEVFKAFKQKLIDD